MSSKSISKLSVPLKKKSSPEKPKKVKVPRETYTINQTTDPNLLDEILIWSGSAYNPFDENNKYNVIVEEPLFKKGLVPSQQWVRTFDSFNDMKDQFSGSELLKNVKKFSINGKPLTFYYTELNWDLANFCFDLSKEDPKVVEQFQKDKTNLPILNFFAKFTPFLLQEEQPEPSPFLFAPHTPTYEPEEQSPFLFAPHTPTDEPSQ